MKELAAHLEGNRALQAAEVFALRHVEAACSRLLSRVAQFDIAGVLLVTQKALVMVGLEDLATRTVLESDPVVDDDAVAPVVDVADVAFDAVHRAGLQRRRERPLLAHPEMARLIGERDLAEVVAVRTARDRRWQEAGSRRFEFQTAVVVGEHGIVDDEGPRAQALADVWPVLVRLIHYVLPSSYFACTSSMLTLSGAAR